MPEKDQEINEILEDIRVWLEVLCDIAREQEDECKKDKGIE